MYDTLYVPLDFGVGYPTVSGAFQYSAFEGLGLAVGDVDDVKLPTCHERTGSRGEFNLYITI